MRCLSPRNAWHHWLLQPQRLWWRSWLLQLHRWLGVIAGVYLVFASVTGSVLVYRNELYRAVMLETPVSLAQSAVLTDLQLEAAVLRLYPGATLESLWRGGHADQAVVVRFVWRDAPYTRWFEPRTGADLGDTQSTGARLLLGLIDLHANLLSGSTGRQVNGVGALALLGLCVTGLVIWWPGIRRWRRSMTLPVPWRAGVGVRRLIWDLHSAMGFWNAGFMLMLALSGVYLCYPASFHAVAEWLQPMTALNAGQRLVDQLLYWLAFLHFGRINGIGIPCTGAGVCDQTTKLIWCVLGLAPSIMFITGGMMWWNRSWRRRWHQRRFH